MVYQVTTACNGPRVNPQCLTPLEEYLDRCLFVGGVHDALTVGIRDKETEPYLTIHGSGAEFQPVPASVVADHDGDRSILTAADHADHEQFLTDIAEYLDERCIVQVVGHDKARFPLTAVQHAVSANGEYDRQSLSWDDI